MRLLITADTIGGVWTYSLDLAAGMLERGAAVLLVTVGRGPDSAQRTWLTDAAELWPEQFRTEHLPVPLEWMDDGGDGYARSEGAMLRLCSAFTPDVVHCNQFCYGALAMQTAVPKVVVAHSDVLSWWRARYGQEMPDSAWRTGYVTQVRAGLEGADIVIAPTAASLAELRESFSFGTVAKVIPNGRTTASGALPESDVFAGKRLQAVTCGRLWDEGKNVALLERLPSPGLPVLVAGERGPGMNAELPDEPDGVRSIGALAPAALEQLLRESALYIVTSRYEPFGLAAVEAALAGCAVIASDLASQREVWGDAAVYFRSDDAGSLGDVLCALATNPERLRAVAERCRRRALAKFSAGCMVLGYGQLYRELIAARGVVGSDAGRGVCVA